MDQDPGTDETRANTHCCVHVQLGEWSSLSDFTLSICKNGLQSTAATNGTKPTPQ